MQLSTPKGARRWTKSHPPLIVRCMTSTDVVGIARMRAQLSNGEARAMRECARVSRAEIAAALGVHETAVEKWESGTRSPRGEVALRYKHLLEQLAEVR
jgi:DNA-binding transcriptional regulator YiaG